MLVFVFPRASKGLGSGYAFLPLGEFTGGIMGFLRHFAFKQGKGDTLSFLNGYCCMLPCSLYTGTLVRGTVLLNSTKRNL